MNAGNLLTSFSRRTLLHEVSIPRRYNVDGRIKTNLSGSIEAISQHRVEELRNLSHGILGLGTSQKKKSTALPVLAIHK